MRVFSLIAIATVLPVAAYADVAVSDAWARASILASRPGAAYLTLTSDQNDRLIAITTPAAGRAMIHVVQADSAGVIRMTPLNALDLPPDTPVTMAPGGMHLMLVDIPKKLEEGTTFPLTLAFEVAGEVTIGVRVLGPGSSGPDGE